MAVDTFGFPPGVASHGIEVFESSGIFYPKAGVSDYYITACGGGGAGGIGNSSTLGGSGGNSGEGVYKVRTYIPAPVAITIGAAGQANNGAGGNTFIGSTTAPFLTSYPTSRWPNGIALGSLLGGSGGVNSGAATDQSYLLGKMGSQGSASGSWAATPSGQVGGSTIFGGNGATGARGGATGRPTTGTDAPWGCGGSGSSGSTTGYGGQGVVIFEW
jgi:hypothetical protein